MDENRTRQAADNEDLVKRVFGHVAEHAIHELRRLRHHGHSLKDELDIKIVDRMHPEHIAPEGPDQSELYDIRFERRRAWPAADQTEDTAGAVAEGGAR